jgi:hypothetical protein
MIFVGPHLNPHLKIVGYYYTQHSKVSLLTIQENSKIFSFKNLYLIENKSKKFHFNLG